MNYKKRQEWFLNSEQTLASVPVRMFAILIDIVIIMLLFYLIIIISKICGLEITNITWANFDHIEMKSKNLSEKYIQFLEVFLAFLPTIYFTFCTFTTNGQSVGKKIMGIRIISVYHSKIGLWHCTERSLGYVASTLELGIGFIQVFWNPNRMTLHDRIAETIVIKSRIRNKKAINRQLPVNKSMSEETMESLT